MTEVFHIKNRVAIRWIVISNRTRNAQTIDRRRRSNLPASLKENDSSGRTDCSSYLKRLSVLLTNLFFTENPPAVVALSPESPHRGFFVLGKTLILLQIDAMRVLQCLTVSLSPSASHSRCSLCPLWSTPRSSATRRARISATTSIR